MKSKKSLENMEIESNTKLMSPEQLKTNLLNINNYLCCYINSLNQNYDESPEHLNNTIKYSEKLMNEFTNFYEQFNKLTEEALIDNTNQKQNYISSNHKKIVIDNKMIKNLSDLYKNNLNKLESKNNDTKKAIQSFEEELKNLKDFVNSKQKKQEK